MKLQKLLDIYYDYGQEHNFMFNRKNIVFGNDAVNFNIGGMTLRGEEISWVNDCKYLGLHTVTVKTF